MELYLPMKKLLLALALSLLSSGAWAQCTGVFPANTLCGNLTASPQPPAAFSAAGTIAGPGATTSGHIPTFGNTLGTSLFDQGTITTSQGVNLTGFTSLFQTNVTSANVLSQFFYHGLGITFPASGSTGMLGTNQTWTGTNSFSNISANTTSLAISSNGPITIPLSVSFGGTGFVSGPSSSFVYFNGSSTLSAVAANTAVVSGTVAVISLQLSSSTIAGLPACNASTQGYLFYVTNATSPIGYNQIVSAGSTSIFTSPVFCGVNPTTITSAAITSFAWTYH